MVEALLWIADPHSHQLIGLVVRQRPVKDGFDDAEEGRVDSHAQRRRRDGHGGEAGASPKSPKGVGQIARQHMEVFSRRVPHDRNTGFEKEEPCPHGPGLPFPLAAEH